MGEDVVGEVDAALLAFIRRRVDELLATLDPAALKRARRASEWERVEMCARATARTDSNSPWAPDRYSSFVPVFC